jgi:hypothetical protein
MVAGRGRLGALSRLELHKAGITNAVFIKKSDRYGVDSPTNPLRDTGRAKQFEILGVGVTFQGRAIRNHQG